MKNPRQLLAIDPNLWHEVKRIETKNRRRRSNSNPLCREILDRYSCDPSVRSCIELACQLAKKQITIREFEKKLRTLDDPCHAIFVAVMFACFSHHQGEILIEQTHVGNPSRAAFNMMVCGSSTKWAEKVIELDRSENAASVAVDMCARTEKREWAEKIIERCSSAIVATQAGLNMVKFHGSSKEWLDSISGKWIAQ